MINRLVSCFICATASITFFAKATEHQVAPMVIYHLDQKSAPGYGLRYQFQRNESFNVELGLLHSNDIEVSDNGHTFVGNYDQFMFGANFIKHYSNDLAVNFGIGSAYVFNSNNEVLIEEDSVAPYLKVGASYQLFDNMSLDIGQFSQFGGDELSTNHSVYLAFNWSFGAVAPTTIIKPVRDVPKLAETSTHAKPNMQETIKPVEVEAVVSINSDNIETDSETDNEVNDKVDKDGVEIVAPPAITEITTNKQAWYVQLGAFNSQTNAEAFISKHSYLTSNAEVVKQNELYKVVISEGYDQKSDAINRKNQVKTKTNLSSFLTKLKE